jgi:predicted enzyme related to lactoylglutathione lyase
MLFVRNITFMSAEPRRLADFWAAALGFTERRDDDTETIVADADWAHPRLTFQKVDDADGRATRVHLDLTADDREAEVARLCSLGATRRRDVSMPDGWTWTVVTDPDGNELCITDP